MLHASEQDAIGRGYTRPCKGASLVVPEAPAVHGSQGSTPGEAESPGHLRLSMPQRKSYGRCGPAEWHNLETNTEAPTLNSH